MGETSQLPAAQLLTLADTCLLWGHRLSEWCGHGPALEEDLALSNTALDVIGQARSLYQLHAARLGGEITEDSLAYFRDADQFSNVALAAVDNGDYAQTTLRSLYLAAWFVPLWETLADSSSDAALRVIATEAAKASRTQCRHAADWVVRFGDGTDQSRQRLDAAIASLRDYLPELFVIEIADTSREARNIAWFDRVNRVFSAATLPPLVSASRAMNVSAINTASSARLQLLAEMQSLAREHPNAIW
jgi:ring-1,2-phenylacetyl-CoA epoxidase subunit PaaC